MKQKNIRSWGHAQLESKEINRDCKTFLKDVFAQPWIPKTGKAIELGCGTGPIIRWVCTKGFAGVGIDVSKTAISMARTQSKGLGIKFKVADLCKTNQEKNDTFDIAIDGHCLHCIIEPKDRKTFLHNTVKMLKKDGLFIVMTMCSPMNREIFLREFPKQKLINHTVYVPYDENDEYEGCRIINGQNYLPTRYVGHHKTILAELSNVGFKPQLIRYNRPTAKCPNSGLAVAALK